MEVSAITKQRLPSGKACASCRKRKNRCDGSRPRCSTCRSRGISCDYPVIPLDKLTIEELKALMNAKLNHGDELPDSDAELPCPGPSQIQRSTATATNIDALSNSRITRATPTDRFDFSCDRAASSSTASTVTTLESNPSYRSRDMRVQTPPPSSPSDCQEPNGFFGDSSTFAFVSEISSSSVHRNRSRRPEKRRRLSSTAESLPTSNFHPTSTAGETSDLHELPSKHLADELVDAYFAHVHRLYPFVHEPSFRLDYERMWTLQRTELAQLRPLWFGLLNMVFAHGCEFCDSIRKEESVATASKFVGRARHIVFAHVFTQGSLELVQTLLLLCHYLQSTLELNECWGVVGLMIRTSISLGLHSSPASLTETTSVRQEMRKRIWWGCYIIDRTLSMKLGRPPSILRADTFDVDMPLDVDDQYITQDALAARQPTGRPSLTTFFIQTIKLADIVEKVLLCLYHPSQRKKRGGVSLRQEALNSYTIGHAILLDGELLSWWDDVPAYLRHEPDVPDGPEFRLQRNVLFIRFLNLRLIIHRQSFLIFNKHGLTDPLQQAVVIGSSKTCISAARETILVIHSQYRRRLLNSMWYNLHYVFTAMGVLLCLQTMDKTKLNALGETGDEKTLEVGMDFLQAASTTSTLAASYVAMLRRIQSGPTTTANIPPTNQQHTVGIQGSASGANTPPIPFTQDEGEWLANCPGDFGLFDDSYAVDFSDLLFGTGLPRDLLTTDWSASDTLL